MERKQSRRLGVYVREATRKARGRGARPPPWRALHPRGPLVAPLTYFFLLYIPIYPKNFGEQKRSGVPPPEASVATENQSTPVPAPCRRGEYLSGGHLHHPGTLHNEEGVVHPRGPLVAPLTDFFRLYMSIYPKNIEEHNRSGVAPREASVATENESRPVPAPCRRGESLSGGHLHHPDTLHDEEGVVHPRG